MRDPELGEVEKVVGNRARVTASNNVFSPLCVLAARERAEGTGGGACHLYPRARCYPTWDRACLYTLRNQFRQYCLLRTGHEGGRGGGEKGMKRGSLSRPRQPLALFVRHSPCPSHFTRGAVDGFLRSNDGATPKSSRPFVSDSRSSFD